MIAYLRGICQALDAESLVVDVHGVGYLVFCSERDLARHHLGGDVELLVHTVVREDALLLYGFADAAGRDVFRGLLTVPGVGPKGALALLSVLTPAEIVAAVHGDRVAQLTRAKGIGKRLAETIVVKLRDRLAIELGAGAQTPTQVPVAAGTARDLVSALGNLGYKPTVADAAVDMALKANPDADFDALLRASLALLRRPG